MKPDPIKPGPGQESVWDYPRPPRPEPSERQVVIRLGDVRIADSSRTIRILETSHPPTYYIPPMDVVMERLHPSPFTTVCEWKGRAVYFDLLVGETQISRVAWSYPQPTKRFQSIAGYIAFYPHQVECYLDGERVQTQAGGFYGGWVTADVVGPFKGGSGTGSW